MTTKNSPVSFAESCGLKYGTKGGTWLTLADIGDMMDWEMAMRAIAEAKKGRK